ncbi:GGDEF domain-containing protein [Acidisoma silvae]|uniref:diguanylate cyclase n=1 Tax=Acidisoma silvae TaxID=2802396 RepID=A0A964DYE9_9PROT|nr:GGDEF domain-containing protein [Acidisoma silvae]MCB8875012.1 diguanylate cyclase [Acidisoma silvae]
MTEQSDSPFAQAVIAPFAPMVPGLALAWDLSCTGRVEAALALAQQVHEEALAADDPLLRASAATHLSWYCFMQGYYEEGLLHVLSARDFYTALGDRPRESWSRAIYAWLLIEVGSPNEALDEAMQALELAETAQEQRLICFALNVVGVVFWMLGQLDRAQEFASRAVAMARGIDQPVDLARWLINLGDIEALIWRQNAEAVALGRIIGLAEEALQLTRESGDAWAARLVICSLTEYQLLAGELTAAADILAEWDLIEGGAGTRSRIYYLYARGKLEMAAETLPEAARTLTECATLTAEISDFEIGVPVCERLSEACAAAGDFAAALTWHREFHARYVRKHTETALIRSRVAAIQYETRHLQARVEAEQSRADGLEEMNRALAQEAAVLMSASMEDVLTGLPNRRGLERALLAVGSQISGAYAIAMIDLDHFKQVNDSLSHAVGDEVLRQVATLLKVATRGQDRLFRYGGEEFVLLAEGADTVMSARTCHRICQVMRNWDWSRIHPRLQVTLSIGIAQSAEGANPTEVMALADERLYEAKNAGRDRVVMHGPAMDAPSLTPAPRFH